MSDLIRVTRGELAKLARRPAAWVLLAAPLILNEVFGYLIPYLSYRSGDSDLNEDLSPEQLLATTFPSELVPNTLGGFPVFAGALALVFGALVFGGEYGWGTVKTLFTQGPSRLAVVGGQLLALGVAIAVGLLVMFGVGAVTSLAIATAENGSTSWPAFTDLLAGMAAGWLILFMWASLGAVLGVLLRSVALPVGLGVVWVLGVENLVSAMASSVLEALEPVRDLLPGVNAGSLVSAVVPQEIVDAAPGVTTSVDGWRALLTVTAYVVVAGVVTLVVSRRRDVT
jgi:ABC-type transport system involved in multi-copper enzyme maturation permease subunit